MKKGKINYQIPWKITKTIILAYKSQGLLSTGPVDDWAQALWTPCFDVYVDDCHKLGPELFYAYHAPHNN